MEVRTLMTSVSCGHNTLSHVKGKSRTIFQKMGDPGSHQKEVGTWENRWDCGCEIRALDDAGFRE